LILYWYLAFNVLVFAPAAWLPCGSRAAGFSGGSSRRNKSFLYKALDDPWRSGMFCSRFHENFSAEAGSKSVEAMHQEKQEHKTLLFK
jgi:hypothetical protein